MESKSENFYNLFKNSNCPIEKIKPGSLDYLFEIPETRPFFDWFFNNVNESCYISKEKLDAFNAKAAKGQVIYDLEKLEEMHKLVNLKQESKEMRFKSNNLRDQLLNESGFGTNEFDVENCNDIEILKRQIEKTEAEVELLKRKHEFNKFCQRKFNEDLKVVKTKEEVESRLISRLEEKENYVKNTSKTLNQSLNKTFIDFQAKLSDEERFNFANPSEEESAEIENYLAKEKSFLNLVKKFMYLELDCTDLKSLKSKLDLDKVDLKVPTQNELNDQKQFQIIMKCKFPKAMDEWIQSKIASRMSKSVLDELNKIESEFDNFFVHTEDQLRENAHLVSQIEEQMIENEKSKEELLEKYKNLTKLMPTLINQLAYLKMSHLACIDLEKKEIDLNLFFNKQDKLFKCLNSQKSRIDFLNYLQNLKLSNLDNLKQLFDELIDDNNSQQNKTNAQNSILTTSIVSAPMISMIQPKINLNYSNFNQFQNTNILSSTLAFNSNMCNQFLSSPSKQIGSKLNHFNEPQSDPNSAFIHILNQFLITVLTKFDQSDDLNGEIFKLKNPISINFNDNLENYINLKNAINSFFKSSNNLVVLEKQCKYFYDGIVKAIEYLYEKDESNMDSTSKLKSTLSYNLSKTNVRMTKCLEEPIKKLNEQSIDLQNLFAVKIIQSYNQFRNQFATNRLANIKRSFFVHFYTNPKQMETIMEQLNQINM